MSAYKELLALGTTYQVNYRTGPLDARFGHSFMSSTHTVQQAGGYSAMDVGCCPRRFRKLAQVEDFRVTSV